MAEARKLAYFHDRLLANPALIAPLISAEWADEAELARVRAAALAWAERPAAFCAWMYCAAVGWVGDASSRAAAAPVAWRKPITCPPTA